MQTHLTRATAVLAGVCAVAVFLYGAFLLLAVSHTAARSAAQKQIGAVSARLGDVEMRYLTATKELTLERALALGYVVPPSGASAVVFATPASHALSLRQ